jgi:hypothetical protein
MKRLLIIVLFTLWMPLIEKGWGHGTLPPDLPPCDCEPDASECVCLEER